MKPLQDIAQTRRILQRMVSRGLITIEHLDEPSPGFRANTAVDASLFPNGYQGITYRNPLRDHPSQVQDSQPSQALEASEPDYDPAAEFPF